EYGNNSIVPANNIRIVAKDYAGNRDTVLFKVNVQQNNKLENVVVYPSPAKDRINLTYTFLGRNLNENSIVRIYNLMGQVVKIHKFDTRLGDNNIQISLFDNYGDKLPSGVYFYELEIQSTLWTEPQKGIFIIAN
ncbi:MAG: T9SS type A sorting domain-containing protein, partial [Candidatus Kapaibacteriota bacterium]